MRTSYGSFKLFNSVVRHRFVTISPYHFFSDRPKTIETMKHTFNKVLKVWSLSGSGKHARNASRALQIV